MTAALPPHGTGTPAHPSAVAAQQAAERIAELTGVSRHQVALVMGSGWGPAATALGTPAHDRAGTEIPGFAPSAVAGHSGRILSVPVGDRHALVFLGRTHLHEGRGTDAVAHGVRTAVAAGCRTVVLTNSCGGLRADLRRHERPTLPLNPPLWTPGCPLRTSARRRKPARVPAARR